MSFDELYEFDENTLGGTGIAIKGYKAKNDPTVTDISIPSEHNGVPVTDLNYEAFGDAVYLRSVYVPDSVKRIWGCCFARCSSLEKVRLPETLYMFSSYIFWECSSLKEVTFPKNITELPVACFMGCSSLERIELPEGLKTIESMAFLYCVSLKEITLPKSMVSVDGYDFETCTALENIIFKNPKTDILRTFDNCSRLSADVLLMSALYTADIANVNFAELAAKGRRIDWEFIARDRVFRRALELNKFDGCDTSEIAKELVKAGNLPNIIRASEHGWITTENIDSLINTASENKNAEMTAWLLDHKNRKFGSNGEDNYELQ